MSESPQNLYNNGMSAKLKSLVLNEVFTMPAEWKRTSLYAACAYIGIKIRAEKQDDGTIRVTRIA